MDEISSLNSQMLYNADACDKSYVPSVQIFHPLNLLISLLLPEGHILSWAQFKYPMIQIHNLKQHKGTSTSVGIQYAIEHCGNNGYKMVMKVNTKLTSKVYLRTYYK